MAVQLVLGDSKIESTVRYLGIEVDDAIEIAEKIDISLTRSLHQRTWSAMKITSTTLQLSSSADGITQRYRSEACARRIGKISF